MRLTHRDGSTVHLAYCTNVHPAETLAGITAQLDDHAVRIRSELAAPRLGVGLWLPAAAAAELAADEAAVKRLRGELTDRGLETVTLNGFPYGGFHDPVVKHAVYHPDWSEPARLDYTLNLARVLAALLPDDAARGSISTLPLGWRHTAAEPWTPNRWRAAQRQLHALTTGLKQIEADTGRTIRVAFEPEPGCAAETLGQAAELLVGTDPGYLGLCVDTCHLAVANEEPAPAIAYLRSRGVPVVKLQASAALQADHPAEPAVRTALESFVEPRFLHQTKESREPGRITAAADDLDEALAGKLPGEAPWRVHYHVPLHREPEPPLRSTRPVLRETLRALYDDEHPVCDHLEVETYTWSVLPEAHRPGTAGELAAGIAAELSWTAAELTALGLRQESE
ncbi:metabolite traffic protein EboE [Streptomyces boninensis]|uniref:metabolite traffic protein EboE n=1 Tax=Streptomyces boninensis TaxID=2039455 RepID=UPI003B21E3F2